MSYSFCIHMTYLYYNLHLEHISTKWKNSVKGNFNKPDEVAKKITRQRVFFLDFQTVSVGGWHVSHFLKQAMTWKDKKEAVGATVSSLDTSQVKQKCRLSLNLARENDMVHQGHSLHIRYHPEFCYNSHDCDCTITADLRCSSAYCLFMTFNREGTRN